MTFPLFKTPRRLAAFVLLAAVALAAAAHLLVGWLWPAEEEARELRERLRTAGIGLSWEGAGRDLALSLNLHGVELGPLAVERMELGADRLVLAGVRLEADGLGLIAEILAALDRRRLALEGELELGLNLTLAGGWSGGLAGGRLTLAGEANLLSRGREVELASTVYHSGGATHLVLESEGSLVFGRLGPGAFLFSPRLEAAELTGLWGDEPLQVRGAVVGLGRPDEGRWSVWSPGVELRRRGAPEEFSTGPFFFMHEEDGWTAWLAGLGGGRGSGGDILELALAAELDIRHLARSVLPLGSVGSGSAVVEALFLGGREPRLSLNADGVSLKLPEGAQLFLEGSLEFREGVPTADCLFDTGGGRLAYRIEADGKGKLTGTEVELDAAWRGALALRDALPTPVTRFVPLLTPVLVSLALDDCLWDGRPLGSLSGELKRRADGWLAELTLESERGRARCDWRFNLRGDQRIRGRFQDFPLEHLRLLGAGEAGVEPAAGLLEGAVELALRGAEVVSVELDLRATGVDAPLPPFLVSLWRWADTGVAAPDLVGAELDLSWSAGGDEPGPIALRLTSPELRVTLSPGSRAAWRGALGLSGRLEVPPRVARRMAERGVLVFRTPSGWGAVPFHLGGTWAEPRPRLDPVQSRLLAASEPPPGVLDW